MAPPLPDGVDTTELDRGVQRELAGLPTGLAELIGKHIAAAFQLLEEDPQAALEHARFMRTRAARVAVVREAAGVVAYQAEEWAEALSELRTARRLGGGPGLLAIMADCERALGRPERALDLAGSPEARQLDAEEAAELRIVAAGARRDLGQAEAAVVGLQGPDLDERRRDPWSARLFYAYADNLEAVGRTDEAARWFIAAADADEDGETDAAERATVLGGADADTVEQSESGSAGPDAEDDGAGGAVTDVRAGPESGSATTDTDVDDSADGAEEVDDVADHESAPDDDSTDDAHDVGDAADACDDHDSRDDGTDDRVPDDHGADARVDADVRGAVDVVSSRDVPATSAHDESGSPRVATVEPRSGFLPAFLEPAAQQETDEPADSTTAADDTTGLVDDRADSASGRSTAAHVGAADSTDSTADRDVAGDEDRRS